MKRKTMISVVLFAAIAMILLAGCTSTNSTAKSVLKATDAEVTLAAHQAGAVAASSGSLGMELSMPLWLALSH